MTAVTQMPSFGFGYSPGPTEWPMGLYPGRRIPKLGLGTYTVRGYAFTERCILALERFESFSGTSRNNDLQRLDSVTFDPKSATPAIG